MPPSELDEIRRETGRRLIQEHGASKVAKLLGHASPSTLSQIFGPNPTREPSEKFCRRMEQVLDLPTGHMDSTEHLPPIGADTTADFKATFVSAVNLVGEVAESESLTLSGTKFSSLVLWAVKDAVDHGGQPREECIRSVVKLLK